MDGERERKSKESVLLACPNDHNEVESDPEGNPCKSLYQ